MINDKLIPATFDKVFKILFTSVDTKEYAHYIISEITGIPYDIVHNDACIMNTELEDDIYNNKTNTADILIGVGKNYINIELNTKKYKGLEMRNFVYQSKITSGIYKRGEDYDDAVRIYQINFDTFDTLRSKKTISKCMIMETETHQVALENLEIYHVNIELTRKKWYNGANLTRLEKMVVLLSIDSRSKAKELIGDDKVMNEAYEKLEKLSKNNDLIIEWDYELDARMQQNSIAREEREAKEAFEKLKEETEKLKEETEKLKEEAEKAKEEVEKSKEEAEKVKEEFEKAKDEAEKGKVEGIMLGKEESSKDIARNLLNENIDATTISKVTGLSVEQIQNL